MAVSNQEVAAYLAANPGLTDAQIVKEAAKAGVTPEQLSQVTGIPEGQVVSRIAATLPPGQNVNLGGTWVQPVYDSTGQGETFEQGPLKEVMVYKENQKTGDAYKQYNPSGELAGTNKFQDVGNIGDMLSSLGSDLSPVIIAALTGGGAAGLLGGALNSGLGLGLGTAGTSALGGAALGGLTSAATGGNVLKGAALGGLGGYASGSGMFGGDTGAGNGAWLGDTETLNAVDALNGVGNGAWLGDFDTLNAVDTLNGLNGVLTADQLAVINSLGGADVAGGLTSDLANTLGLGGGFNLSGLTADQLAIIDALGGADVAGGLTTDAANTAGLGGGFANGTTGLNGLTTDQLNVINSLGGADVVGGLTTTDANTAGLGGGFTDVTTGGNTGVTTDVTTNDTTGGDTKVNTDVKTGNVTTGGLTGLTTDQIINLVKSGVSLTGLLGAGKVITGGSGGGGTTTTFTAPTQGIPKNSPEYYRQLQQYYSGYMPQSPRDVVTPLQQWYNSSYGA